MSIEKLTKLVHELATVVRFHELDTVDSLAFELCHQADALKPDTEFKDIDNAEAQDAWYEKFKAENLVDTTR
jgi:hypothetical protein